MNTQRVTKRLATVDQPVESLASNSRKVWVRIPCVAQMKRLMFFAMFLLSCCAYASDDSSMEPESYGKTTRVPTTPPEDAVHSSGGGAGSCGHSTKLVNLPDGGQAVVDVPILCDPLWWVKDHGGDPGPWENHK